MKRSHRAVMRRGSAAGAQRVVIWATLVACSVLIECSAPGDVTGPRRVATQAAVATALASDNFNRPDESPIAGSWVSGQGGFAGLVLASAAVRGVTFDAFGAAYWGAATWPANQWSETRLTGLGTSGAGGAAVRIAPGAQTGYVFGVGGGGTWYAVAKFVNGAYTEFTRQSLTFAAGDVIRLEVSGDTLRAFRNGALVISLRDASIPSGNAGLLIYHNDAGFQLDDWQGGSLDATPPPPPPSPPAAPTNLGAAATAPTAIRLSWTDNASDEQGFRIERCSGPGCGAFTEIATTGANAVSYNDGGLAASTSYTYRVRAYNSAGVSSYSSPATATTPAATASDKLPDLAMAQLANLNIQSVSGRQLLRYSTTIVNVGQGPYEVHGHRASTSDSLMSVVQRIYNSAGGWREVSTTASLIFGGDGHNHWHVKDLEISQLFSLSDGSYIARSNKRGYCFWDNVQYRLSLPGAPQSPVYNEPGCGRLDSLSTNMGLSVGWGDIYAYSLPDQNIDITGLVDGRYRLVVTANPNGGFSEWDSGNNQTWVDLDISHHATRLRVLGYGPSAVLLSGAQFP